LNYEEISEHILAELECSLEELESLENREQLERQGIDVQNDIERYSALIDSFKLMVEKAKAFDAIFKLYIGYEDGWIHFPRGSKSFNKEVINVCKYYERGGSDD